MMIKDWWDRLMRKFKGKKDRVDQDPVMSLEPNEAPEPVPERKTSDEVIIAMAESAVEAAGSITEIHKAVTDGAEPDPGGKKEAAAAEDLLSEETLFEEVLSEEVLSEDALSEDAISEDALSAVDPGTGTDEEESDESGQEC